MLEVIHTQKRGLPTRLKGLARWKVPTAVRKDLLRFVEELALGKVNRGVKISEARQAKYLDLLKVPLEFFARPTSAVTLRAVERFEQALSTDRVQSRLKRKPYSYNTKIDIRKALKVYLRWQLGAVKALRLAGWLDTRSRPKTPDYLKEQEVDALFRACRTAEQRFLVAVLFDSGARAQEFLNVRAGDLQLPEGKDNFVRLALKEEYSKTKGRTIALYWRHSVEAVRDYLGQRTAEGMHPDEPVFHNTYDAMRIFLRRLGRRVLHRHVHPHLFRHSSATYYATRLNRQELCYRYGWKFSSNMPDIYISRAGMESKDLDVKFTQTELSSLKDDLTKVEQAAKIKDERIASLQGTIEELQRNMAAIAEVLSLKPTVEQLQEALQKKRAGAPSP